MSGGLNLGRQERNFLMRRQSRQNRRQRQRTPAETIKAEPIAEIPAQTADLNLTEKYPVRQDWVVADAAERKPVSGVSNSLLAGKMQGILQILIGLEAKTCD
jgi:hypothetical protein